MLQKELLLKEHELKIKHMEELHKKQMADMQLSLAIKTAELQKMSKENN